MLEGGGEGVKAASDGGGREGACLVSREDVKV